MDWALQRKEAIENTLAAQHLSNGTLVLYDGPRRRLKAARLKLSMKI
jgi:hypothetical protein